MLATSLPISVSVLPLSHTVFPYTVEPDCPDRGGVLI